MPSPPGRWFHGLFACLEDVALSCTVCVCHCSALGQLYARTMPSLPPRRTCFVVAAALWTLFVLTHVAQSTSNALAGTAVETQCVGLLCREIVDWDQVTAAYVVAGIAGFLALVSSVLGTCLLCTSRRRMRDRDGIPPGACGELDDCCVSYWCGCCALVQMLRQETLVGGMYSACSDTGAV